MSEDDTATLVLEPWGFRLRCACGHEQLYDIVNGYVYPCTVCGREYLLQVIEAGLTVLAASRR